MCVRVIFYVYHGKSPSNHNYGEYVCMFNWVVVVSNMCLFSPQTLGKWSNLTNIFQMGWNHQLVNVLYPWSIHPSKTRYIHGLLSLLFKVIVYLLQRHYSQSNRHVLGMCWVHFFQPSRRKSKRQWNQMDSKYMNNWVHPRRLINIEPENDGSVWKRIFLFQGCILIFHVKLPGCKQ